MASLSPSGPLKSPLSYRSPLLHHQGEEDRSEERSHKRQKVTRACDSCKSRKRRCTGELPCSSCHANGSQCTYLATYTRGRLVQPAPASHLDSPGQQSALRINQTENPGTFAGPSYAYGGINTAKTSRAASPETACTTFAGQYLGPSSPYTFLRRAWKRFEQDGVRLHSDDVNQEEPALSESIFHFGDRIAPPVDRPEVFRLPDRYITAAILKHYFDFAMPTYRFFHRQTVEQWMNTYHESEEDPSRATLLPIREAVILMILASGRLFGPDENSDFAGPDETTWRESERFYRAARAKLDGETGKPRLESIQARIAGCLFLLHTSRPNRAWYSFGTTIQLLTALGLHRQSSLSIGAQDHVSRELRKRTFWAASTLDTYLTVILGRPPLINVMDVDQLLPEPVDDEDLTPDGIEQSNPPKDSIMRASILHAQITRIVKEAAREQYSLERKRSSHKLEAATLLNSETAHWHASLPVVLSGAIHPSSLIPTFRRQITVLQLAHAHAQMMINRPSLLLDTSQTVLRESQIDLCLSAAKSALDAVSAAGFTKYMFQTFWYTQFVSFNALSIIYVWLILRKHGYLPHFEARVSDEEIRQTADLFTKMMMEASESNAPSLRYSIILEELQQEVQRSTQKPAQRAPRLADMVEGFRPSNGAGGTESTDNDEVTRVLESVAAAETHTFMDEFSSFPLDPDLFLSLDTFPYVDFVGTFD